MKKFYEFDPFEMFGIEKPKSKDDRNIALDVAATALKEFMLDSISKGQSPVSGGSWKRTLSKKYAEQKKEISGVAFANLELYGDMLDDMVVEARGDKIVVGFESTEQAQKADGHNHSGIFGDSSLPKREFIPKEGGKFKRDILSELKSIIEENLPQEE